MRLLVLGAGLQGSACAYDLLERTDHEVVLADIDVEGVTPFLEPHIGRRLTMLQLDAEDRGAVRSAMEGVSATMSAFPYYYNLAMAVAALDAGSHFCDLGGNTDIVQGQKELHDRAVDAGLSIVPDCGLAPGMVNILAAKGIRSLDRPREVYLKVGGLPQNPEPPLNYQVVYSLEGVIDYYTSRSWILRDGGLTQVDALSEVEIADFPGIGPLEAFHTAGGLSLMAQKYAGQIERMEYKT
ncbi:MAG TPA: saccharopine dehydrogenase NADP-binding domain-containing protein, partial [Longimicrobiaceae bacterium]|nr:saccharopine dehydrogenase NADP-binding domain-containing protein [Longimicrobiaceae bacterium]